MPDPSGAKLTAAQLNAAKQFVMNKGALRPCHACGKSDFDLADSLILAPLFGSDGVVHVGTGYVAFLITCKNCLSMRLHAAAGVPGLMPGAQKAVEDGK